MLTLLVVHGQSFENIGAEQGVFASSFSSEYGNGVSFYDFDKDGWDDLSYGQVNTKVKFFKNNEGVFEEVDFGLPIEPNAQSVTWVDFDNDGDADLFVTNRFGGCHLYSNQGDMTFVNSTPGSGFFQDQAQNHETYGSAWGDYDNDGLLDVYISNYNNVVEWGIVFNYLYHNNGDGTFTDVTDEAGVANGMQESFQAVWIDYNDDGWLDFYVINDKAHAANTMYKNNGDGTFDDVSEELGLDLYIFAMSNSWADYDNDRDMDVYVTNDVPGNSFMENLGTFFWDVAPDYNMEVFSGCWSANWIDFENDMDQDLYVSTTYHPGLGSQNFAFLNEGDDFSDANFLFEDNIWKEHNTVCGDVNNDGLTDLGTMANDWITNNIWLNTSDENNNYIKISLEGTISNRDGISSWIEIFTGDTVQTRLTYCGEDFMTQDSQREIIGMGSYSSIDSLIISWMSGHVDVFYDVDVNQTLHIIEGSSIHPQIELGNQCLGQEHQIELVGNYENWIWNTGSADIAITPIVGESYYVTVTNALGISVTSDTIVYQEYANPEVLVTITNPSCNGVDDGSIEVSNLTGVETETVLWSNDEEGALVENLSDGFYVYNMIDTNGCESEGLVGVYEPPELIVSSTLTEITCYGFCNGAVSFDIEGGTGEYTVDSEQEDLCAGEHEFIIYDANDCEANQSFVLEEPNLLTAESSIIDALCFEDCNGSISLEITGGTGSYEIANDTTELCAGDYTIIITDANDCTFEIQETIEEPEELSGEISIINVDDELGSASIEISGGTEPYLIEWSNGDEGESTEDLDINNYSVSITDENDCTIEYDFEITVGISEINIEGILIYPNPTENVLFIKNITENTTIKIYDVNGRMVFRKLLLNDSNIDLSTITPGCYVIELQNGKISQKTILQKL